jgi:predicted O-methyltransferase YrrM
MNIKIIIRKVLHRISIFKNKVLNKQKFQKEISDKLPSNFIDLLNFSYNSVLSRNDIDLGNKIESFRLSVADEYKDKGLSTYASPRSGSKLVDNHGKIIPGSFVESKKGGFARTGTGIKTGIQLKKIAESLRAQSVLELGTNTGLSGCYFLSSKDNPFLYTIEGSSDLCKIAEANLSKTSKNFHVDNGMFDDVMDLLSQKNKKFDLAFVDGQHEEQATLHYAQKLKSILNPGGAILFDDIFWSEGMNSAWNSVASDSDFSMTLDIGTRGLCILKEDDKKIKRIKFELTNFTGKPLYNREGW